LKLNYTLKISITINYSLVENAHKKRINNNWLWKYF